MKDISGLKFNGLLVISSFRRDDTSFLKCVCDCGQETIKRRSDVLSGKTSSCGCHKKKLMTSHGRSKTKEYRCYSAMLQRCYNNRNPVFKYYGERGISVCEDWLRSFENFLMDMGMCPKGLTLERIDVNGNYCKENCIWENRNTQQRNKTLSSNNNSGHNGVGWDREREKWVVQIVVNNKKKFVGRFENIEDAISARKLAEDTLWEE